jgi:GH25 family lysozyme M1 (1,4-beta-N-acetylmuramidase)
MRHPLLSIVPAIIISGCTLFQHAPSADEAPGDCPIAIRVEGWAELDLRENHGSGERWIGQEFHSVFHLPEGQEEYAYQTRDDFDLTGQVINPKDRVDEAGFLVMDMYSSWVGSDRDETLHPPEDGYTRYAYDRDQGILWAQRAIKSQADTYEHELEVTELLINETAAGPIVYLEYKETYFQGGEGESCTEISQGDMNGAAGEADPGTGSTGGSDTSGSSGSSGGSHDGDWSACGEDGTVDGIDVSYWQGSIDWGRVADDGIDFAIVRVADGFYEDPDFETNYQGARNAGIVRGSYQFFRAGRDGGDQADLLLRKLGSLDAEDIPPVLDIETTDGYSTSHVADEMVAWLDTVERATGRVPIIYTSPGLWPSMVGSADFSDYHLWVAHWTTGCPTLPSGWDHWAFWQTSSSGSIDGISGNVDTDLFNGDYQDLLDWVSSN